MGICDRNGATAEWNKWQQKINRRKDKKQKTETHQMHFVKEWKKRKIREFSDVIVVSDVKNLLY